MESKASMLKKLAARITTANGDVSAVQGTSMSEIIKFMQENLNVVDGALKVSEILENLIQSPITFDLTKYAIEQKIIYNGSYSLGLVDGQTYKVVYKVNGEEQSFTAPASSGSGHLGFGEATSFARFAFTILDNTSVEEVDGNLMYSTKENSFCFSCRQDFDTNKTLELVGIFKA